MALNENTSALLVKELQRQLDLLRNTDTISNIINRYLNLKSAGDDENN